MFRVESKPNSDIVYYIDEEKRTIIAKMTVYTYEKDDSRPFKLIIETLEARSFTGKAYCAMEDKWDEEIGKRIAREKMLTKYYRYKIKNVTNNIKQYEKIIEDYYDLLHKYTVKYNKYNI